jgi:hypothetical protein
MIHRALLAALLLFLPLALRAGGAAAAERLPNFVIIFIDDKY